MNKHSLIFLLLASTTLMASCGSVAEEPASETPPAVPTSFVYDEAKFVAERNTLLTNLTETDEQYNYYINKDPAYDYSSYRRTDKTNEFLSWEESTYSNINGKDVTTNFYYWPGNSQIDHPNIGIGLLLYRAIKYKLANPTQENEVCITSFHYSLTVAVNLVKESQYYGTMKPLDDEMMDRDGYVRITYLTAYAASIGIHVYIAPQLGATNPLDTIEGIDDYYLPLLNQPCSSKHGLGDHKIGEYLHYNRCKWVSYDGKSAADMFHIKTLLAKHYLGDDGLVHDNTVFTTSANLDSAYADGTSGGNISQTGLIVSNHEYLYRAHRNFIVYSSKYFNQDDVFEFRKDFKAEIARQKAEISANGYQNILDTMMIYLGSEQDKVFEVQFAPSTEYMTSWTNENPYCKYVDKLLNSRGAISLYFTNPKAGFNADILQTFLFRIIKAFKLERAKEEIDKSVFYFNSPSPDSLFEEIVEGVNVGRKVFNHKEDHQKDILFEYEEAGKRCSTLMMTTSNYHAGSNFYQVNSCLLIKQIEGENASISNAFKTVYEQYELKVN